MYFYDTGILSAVNYSLSEDHGKLLENLVAIELLRRKYEIFYGKNGKECDFIAKKRGETLAVQVCYKLTEKNIKRETKGLESFDADRKLIIYYYSDIKDPDNAMQILDFLEDTI
ncbi:MAG: hypothetical protein C0601_13590 [Candidatus Muiribacterium halophilum]|uniref:DUF4143 domain-containing protein n=1 Tax=Muiribacterium halophilum TaxID=2053465 RepID=A0A2N5Z958_MUIH1|nr:MAG: hypothetical protein C0601_13590 [Candidatus Muirbacterium halophilum]